MINKTIFLIALFTSLQFFSQITMQKSVEYHFLLLGQDYKAFVFSSETNNLFLLTNNIDFKEKDLKAIASEQHPRFLVSYNRAEDSFYQENPFSDSKNENLMYDLALDKDVKIRWSLSNDVKTILGFKCQKAVAEFRGRTWTSWFTNEISDSIFPWKLKDLPGVTLEAYDSKEDFHFTAVKFVFNSNVNLPKSLEKFFTNETESKTALYKNVFDAETKQLSEWQSMQLSESKQTVTPTQIPPARSASFEVTFE